MHAYIKYGKANIKHFLAAKTLPKPNPLKALAQNNIVLAVRVTEKSRRPDGRSGQNPSRQTRQQVGAVHLNRSGD
jgi:hypothetical protein